MLPKSNTIIILMACLTIQASLFSNSVPEKSEEKSSSIALNNVVPSMYFDFNACVSFFGGSNMDYSEFTADYTENIACTELEIVSNNLYRIDPQLNPHSCAPGLDDTPAMCIGAQSDCTYLPGSSQAVRVDVKVIPGTDGIGSLSAISFYERAPEQFSYLEGPTGPNNFPTKYGLRVSVDGVEIFSQSEIATTKDWSMEYFSFSGLSNFTVTEEKVFNIEILPYCLVGNGASVHAWDIENLRIIGGCNNVVGGNITTAGPSTLCDASEANSNLSFSVSNQVGSNFNWVLIDSDNIILAISDVGNFNFFPLGLGVYTVFHLAYDNGLEGLTVGEDIMDLDGCYDFSNGIEINNFQFEGGELLTSDKEDNFYVCLGDDEDDIVTVELSGAVGLSLLYVVTDDSNMILEISNNTSFDFGGVTPGTCFIYAVSYGGILNGLQVGNLLSNVTGCFELSTAITVDRDMVNGGNISFDGEDELSICGSEGSAIEIDINGVAGSNSAYIITDNAGVILSIQSSQPIDVTMINSIELSVIHLSYEDNVDNLTVGETLANLNGCFDASNTISIFKEEVLGGVIELTGGGTSTTICLNDENIPFIEVDIMDTMGDTAVWLVTDTSGLILTIQGSNQFDFSNVPPGICLIRNISYEFGVMNLQAGNNVSDLLGCYDLSNPIEVIREMFNGGMISSTNGINAVSTCVGDGADEFINFSVFGASGTLRKWLLTDNSGDVLEISDVGSFNFEDAPGGTCFVYHIAYADPQILMGTDLNVNSLTGCFDLSNSIAVVRQEVEGGVIDVDEQTSLNLCPTADIDSIIVSLTGNIGMNSSFFLTDSLDEILIIRADGIFDLTPLSDGVYSIWHISYFALNNYLVGQSLDELSGCLELSNAVSVTKIPLDGGSIMTSDGLTELSICVGDGITEIIDIDVENASGALMSFIVSDTLGNVLDISDSDMFDLEGAGSGVCQIWHISYTDSMTLAGIDLNINSLQGCFDLSNSVTIERQEVVGGTIDVEGQTMINLCPTGDIDSIVVNLMGNVGMNSSFFLTDAMDTILSISTDDVFDFTSLSDGTYFIRHISYFALDNYNVATVVDDLEGCFDLSNVVSVTKLPLDGGSIMTSDSLIELSQCIGDGIVEIIDVEVSDASGANMSFLITDTMGNVLVVTDNEMIDLENAGGGVCQIWHISYTDSSTVTGMNLNINTLQGCFDLSNSITVTRNEVAGGNLTTGNGLTDISIIIGDGLPDEIDGILTDAIGESMSWIITDTLGEILALPDTLPFDFENSGAGVCQIWNVSFNDNISGLTIGSSLDSLSGCLDLSNPITITRVMVSGGMVMTTDSLTVLTICAGDGESDSIDVTLEGNQGTDFAWLITDTSGVILDLPSGPPFDFESAGNGICLIWHLSYINAITGLDIGENIDDLIGSYDFSNSIEVTRNGVDGGAIMSSDSLTIVEICSGDGNSDIINVVLENASGPNSEWLLTDSNQIILLVSDTSAFNFEGVEAGTCFIYHISYFGGTTGIEVDSSILNIEGCFDLSNEITVIREVVNGGILLTDMGLDTVNIVTGDGISDAFDVTLTDTVGLFSDWLITNSSNQIIGLPPGPPFDLENAGGGMCQIWHLSFNDAQTIEIGMTLDEFEGCYELSNPITVIREGINGGTIMTPDNQTAVELCVGDMVSDSVDVILSDTMGSFSSWIITDTFGLILDLPSGPPFDFSGAGDGVCQIWHLIYEGTIMNLEIDSSLNDLQGSFDLSNEITVTRNVVEGGDLMTSDSLTAITVMVADGIPDLVDPILENNEGDNSSWVITDSLGVILALPISTPFDFENTGSGVCQIYNISYADTISGLVVNGNINQLVGCFDFSNPITVTRTGVNGGILLTTNFTTSVTICAGDGIADPIGTVLSDTVGTNFQWLITDTSGLILGLPLAPPFDLEGAGAGICQIWNLAHENDLMGDTLGGNINNFTGTFDFSNPITVTRNGVNGGSITTAGGLTEVTITVGEGITDTVDVAISGLEGELSQWVITDTLGVIMALPAGPPFFFEDQALGVCQIWSVGYSSGLTGLEIGNTLDQLSGCFDLSNPITVIRDGIDGGVIATIDGLTIVEICVSDNINDTIQVTLMDTIGTTSNWVVVNNSGIILSIDTGPPFVFGNTFVGTCFIYHMISEGPLMGFAQGFNINNIVGFYDLSNPIRVDRDEAVGGTINTGGLFEVFITVGEGIDDTVTVNLAGNIGDLTSFVVTDTLGNIMGLPAGPDLLFETAGPGVCQIWSISYAAGLSGLAIGENIADLEGCYDFSNVITVNRDGVNGGVLTFLDGSTITGACIGDGVNDNIGVILTDTSAMNYAWVLTNEAGLIMGIPIGPPFNFENSPVTTTTLIRHLGYDSIMPPVNNGLVGQNISIFSGNFNFSNPVTIFKDQVDGGTISTTDNLMIVVGEGVVDTVELSLSSAVGDSLIFMASDTLGNILMVQNSPIFTFESAGGGVCQLYNVSFAYGLTGLEVGNKLEDLEGCYHLSNAITVERDGINGGYLTTNDGFTERDICVSDAVNDLISVQLIDTTAPNSAWVITNLSGMILNLPAGPPFVLDSLSGSCRIWHLAYESGIVGLQVGLNIADLVGIYNFSNPLEVTKNDAEGGSISLDNGATAVDICVGDGISDALTVNLSGDSGEFTTWVVTDTFGFILLEDPDFDFDLEGSGLGVCDIRHLSYFNTLTGLVDSSNISGIMGCFDFSNTIRVFKNAVDGGEVFIGASTQDTILCVVDNEPDSLTFTTSSVSGNYQFVITDTFNVISNVLPSPVFDFENSAIGICRVWGVSYTGAFTGTIGSIVGVDNLSDECFAVSDGFVEVVKVNGGISCNSPANNGNVIEFRMFPVPADQYINLDIIKIPTEKGFVRIFNSDGKLMESFDIESFETKDIDISQYVNGVYYIKMHAGSNTKTDKFIIVR